MTSGHALLRSHWFVACRAKELTGRRPLPRRILGQPVVLLRGSRPVALLDRCPHRGVPLSAGRCIEGLLECSNHGWRFDEEGRCVATPGLAHHAPPPVRVPRFEALEAHGLVWVRLAAGDGFPPAPPSAALRCASFLLVHELKGDLTDALENLLDATHTPFVHGALLRSRTQPQRFTGELRVEDGEVEAVYRGEPGQAGLVSRLFERGRTHSVGRYVPPATAELEYHSARGIELALQVHFTPAAPGRLRAHTAVFLRRTAIPSAAKEALFRPILAVLARQDARVVEAQALARSMFPKHSHILGEADWMRPHIERWLAEGRFTPAVPRKLEFQI